MPLLFKLWGYTGSSFILISFQRISTVKYESNITNNAFNGTLWRYRFTFAFLTFLPIYVRSLNIQSAIWTGQLAWILRRNDRNEPRNEITFHLPRLFIPVDVSLSDSLLPWIDWFIGVSLCKYLFLSPSCFSPSSLLLSPFFLLVSLPLEKKSRWNDFFSFLFFLFFFSARDNFEIEPILYACSNVGHVDERFGS